MRRRCTDAQRYKRAVADLQAELAKKDAELAGLHHDIKVKSQYLEDQVTMLRTTLREREDKLSDVERLNVSLEVEIEQYRYGATHTITHTVTRIHAPTLPCRRGPHRDTCT
jgi:hypothetical protein